MPESLSVSPVPSYKPGLSHITTSAWQKALLLSDSSPLSLKIDWHFPFQTGDEKGPFSLVIPCGIIMQYEVLLKAVSEIWEV